VYFVCSVGKSDSLGRISVYSCSFVVNFKRANARDLLQERFMNITKNLGMLLLAIYLILIGIIALVHIGIPPIVTGILALAAGILILIGR
jgi:predicted membrane protein